MTSQELANTDGMERVGFCYVCYNVSCCTQCIVLAGGTMTYALLPILSWLAHAELGEPLPGNLESSLSSSWLSEALRRLALWERTSFFLFASSACFLFSACNRFCSATILPNSFAWLKMSSSVFGASCQAARLKSDRFLGAGAPGVVSVMNLPWALVCAHSKRLRVLLW